MEKLLDEAFARVRELPEADQYQVAGVILRCVAERGEQEFQDRRLAH